MASGQDCCSPCPTVQTVNIPGSPGLIGDDGDDGTDGINAFTTLTANSNVPVAVGDNVTMAVGDSTWAVVGQVVVIAGPSHYRVVSKPSAVALELEWLDYPNDVAAATAIASGAQVSPSGELPPGFAAAGSPEGAVTASPGATYLNTTDDSFWVKKTGTLTSTGWIAIVVSFLLLLSLATSFGAPPVLRQQFTTNLQPDVMLLATNIAKSVFTNTPESLLLSTNIAKYVVTNTTESLTLMTNISRFVLSSNNVFTGSNYMIGTFVGRGGALTNVPANVSTNATAVTPDISIYFTNQDGRVYRVEAQAL
jgi:hypothetical protein